jgi:hypothetical protein
MARPEIEIDNDAEAYDDLDREDLIEACQELEMSLAYAVAIACWVTGLDEAFFLRPDDFEDAQ